jgi:uncharacterized tellurite resistance protein B-like protein
MNLEDLNDVEQRALEAALYLLVNADGRVRHQERKEVEALAEELGDPQLADRVRDAGERVNSVDDLTPLVAKVEREDAQELIRTVLFDVAQADGQRSGNENAVINLVTREWARR